MQLIGANFSKQRSSIKFIINLVTLLPIKLSRASLSFCFLFWKEFWHNLVLIKITWVVVRSVKNVFTIFESEGRFQSYIILAEYSGLAQMRFSFLKLIFKLISNTNTNKSLWFYLEKTKFEIIIQNYILI